MQAIIISFLFFILFKLMYFNFKKDIISFLRIILVLLQLKLYRSNLILNLKSYRYFKCLYIQNTLIIHIKGDYNQCIIRYRIILFN